ncbi:Outer membrane receptor proteins, mostly Fe transport [Parapedobacter composti]|uniref:Outer membrane receptor proteins, mostly Fe transport n=1 Tax=Parapedobacter composti TaxID=623281 RepID=A0A1I1IKG1_9SPHI|nr:outer membrane beta-barrel family protein [Parapedobacter composti]SFC34738.1 Outer membrane receptor proteins, mostly Fe transport [Parapedobacter composti]
MKTVTHILVSLLVVAGFDFAYAQQATIAGRVIDEDNNPLDLATVTLLLANDSTVVKTGFPDGQGYFELSDIAPGEFLLSVMLVGYEDAISPITITPATPAKSLPAIVLKATNKLLAEVAVTVQRPLVERRPDMLVVNVENSALAAGNTAMDILERSPGVTVDKDDNISLMGKQGVTVMIDGKQTYLSAEQLANFLRNTDGNMIKSIELITNPSSKYDASGTAGMINIVLKKNRLAGTNGTLSLGTGYGVGHKANTSLNLNHKTGRTNVFGTYSYLNNRGGNEFDIFRSVVHGNDYTDFQQYTDFNRKNRSHNYRAGVDYNTSERNVVGLLVSGYASGNDNDNSSNTFIGRNVAFPDSTLSTTSVFDGNYTSITVNANNQFTIDSTGRKLVADVDISRFSNRNKAHYDNTFYLPSGDMKGQPLLSRSDMPTIIDIRVAKVDYTHPMGKGKKLEAGLKYSNVVSDNDMRFENLEEDVWQNDAGRTNHFVYDEQVAAAYVNYSTQWGKWGVQAGLRSEYTVSDGNSITLANRIQRDYLDFFPSVFVNYSISDNHQTGLSYSKRINRPNYGNLNPFEYFLDQYTFEQGNPYLRPEYTHAFDFSYTLMQRYHLSAGYNRTNDVIAESMNQDEVTKRTWVTRDNLAKQNIWYANLNVPVKITKFWNSNTNFNAFYMGFEGPLNGDYLRQGQFAWQLRSNHTFTIVPNLTAEASANYQSSLIYSVYHIAAQWSIDAGLNKSFLDKKANLKLSVSDIFDTRIQDVRTRYNNMNAIVNQKNETRIARLTLTYNFGNMKNGARRNDTQSEEKSRISMP